MLRLRQDVWCERAGHNNYIRGHLSAPPRCGLRLVLDPGLDFAKQRNDNLRIVQHLDRFQHFGRPVLLPVSRKTVIGEVLTIPDPRDRDAGTVALIATGIARGAQIFRVHNVQAAHTAIKTLHALR